MDNPRVGRRQRRVRVELAAPGEARPRRLRVRHTSDLVRPHDAVPPQRGHQRRLQVVEGHVLGAHEVVRPLAPEGEPGRLGGLPCGTPCGEGVERVVDEEHHRARQVQHVHPAALVLPPGDLEAGAEGARRVQEGPRRQGHGVLEGGADAADADGRDDGDVGVRAGGAHEVVGGDVRVRLVHGQDLVHVGHVVPDAALLAAVGVLGVEGRRAREVDVEALSWPAAVLEAGQDG